MSEAIIGQETGGAASLANAFPRYEQTFPGLTAQEIARMQRFGEERNYHHGEALFETGKPGPGMFVVLSGQGLTLGNGHMAGSLRSSIRGRASFSPRSVSCRGAPRWSTAMPRAMSQRC